MSLPVTLVDPKPQVTAIFKCWVFHIIGVDEATVFKFSKQVDYRLVYRQQTPKEGVATFYILGPLSYLWNG